MPFLCSVLIYNNKEKHSENTLKDYVCVHLWEMFYERAVVFTKTRHVTVFTKYFLLGMCIVVDKHILHPVIQERYTPRRHL